MTDNYRPEYPAEFTAEWAWRELQRISQEMEFIRTGHLDVTYVAPSKPRQGDVRYADGSEWDPGSGEGIYRYDGSTWQFLG